MSQNSYKILVAKRLAIDPNELLRYYETDNYVFTTTPDGEEHNFRKSDLDRPRQVAIPIAKTAQKGPDPASAGDHPGRIATKKVAKRK